MNSLRLKNRHMHGASIGEGMMWAAFFGFVLIMALTTGYNLFQDWEGKKAAGLLRDLKTATKQVHSANNRYGNNKSLNKILVDWDKVPADALIGDGANAEIIHPFDGKVTVIGGPNGKTNTFSIAYHSLDDAVCANLASPYLGAAGKEARLVNISFNGSTVKPGFDVDAIASGCSAGDANNKITWTFK